MDENNTKELDRTMIFEKLRKNGCRITEQRKQLVEIILAQNCSNCKEIYYEAAKSGIKVGMATIYRMMNLLEEMGALKWRNCYHICDSEEPQLKSCKVEMEDSAVIELETDSIREIFEKGMETLGYTKGKRIQRIYVNEKISQEEN